MAGGSGFGIFMTREGVIYVALAFPALMVQATYSIVVYRAFDLGFPGSFAFVTPLIGVATLVTVVAAIITFRPTLAMLTIGLSYFAITLLPQTPTADPLILIVALFLLLVSFNYGRAAQTTVGRRPLVSSRGPLHLKILSLSLNGVLPIAAAAVLVAVASITVDLALAEVAILPYPLSDLVGVYLQTRVGFVLLATLAAGILLWVIREFLEPAILYYSLDQAGARQLITEEFGEVRQRLERFLKHRIGVPMEVKKPSRGVIAVGIVLVLLLLGLFGPTPEEMVGRTGEAVGRVLSGFEEKALVQTVSDAAGSVDSNLLRLENLIRYLISIIWGG